VGDFVYNVGKGRAAELYNRVKLPDPAPAELVIMILAATGLETDAVLKRKTTFADIVSGTTNEVTNSGYAKKVLAGAAIAAYAADQTNDRVDLDLPDQTWTAVAAGDGWASLVVGYDPVGSQTMSDIIPLTNHAFVVTPDGSDIVAQFATAGFYRAS
jgi:hypothetical protein